MLDSLRAFARPGSARSCGAFLIVGFAGFGISNVITRSWHQYGRATVGNEDITIRDFQRAYQQPAQCRSPSRSASLRPPSRPWHLGIPSLVLHAPGRRRGDQPDRGQPRARRFRRSGSARCCASDPTFRGHARARSTATASTAVLQQNGFTEDEYFDLQTKAARRQQLTPGLFGDTAVPQPRSNLVNRYSGDTRTIDYFVADDGKHPAGRRADRRRNSRPT